MSPKQTKVRLLSIGHKCLSDNSPIGNSINVVIMRKETLVLTAESQSLRDTMFAEFKECIAFASSRELDSHF